MSLMVYFELRKRQMKPSNCLESQKRQMKPSNCLESQKRQMML
jgi:hypothetical protein